MSMAQTSWQLAKCTQTTGIIYHSSKLLDNLHRANCHFHSNGTGALADLPKWQTSSGGLIAVESCHRSRHQMSSMMLIFVVRDWEAPRWLPFLQWHRKFTVHYFWKSIAVFNSVKLYKETERTYMYRTYHLYVKLYVIILAHLAEGCAVISSNDGIFSLSNLHQMLYISH